MHLCPVVVGLGVRVEAQLVVFSGEYPQEVRVVAVPGDIYHIYLFRRYRSVHAGGRPKKGANIRSRRTVPRWHYATSEMAHGTHVAEYHHLSNAKH